MTQPDIHFLQPPKYVGYYEIGGPEPVVLRVPLARKPRWLTRVLMAWLIEWRWRDEREEP